MKVGGGAGGSWLVENRESLRGVAIIGIEGEGVLQFGFALIDLSIAT
jgi:hypothetical protein